MDYVTRQLVNLTRKLREEVRNSVSDLSNALQKQSKSIDEAKESYRNQAEKPQAVVATAEVHFSPDVERQQRAEQNKARLLQEIIAFAAVGAFFAAAFYAYIAYFQWREMIAATDAAQQSVFESRRNRIQAGKALDATVQQFHLEQRAWIGVDNFSIKPLVPNQKLHVEGKITNSGKTPAFNTTMAITMHFAEKSEDISKFAVSPRRAKAPKEIIPSAAVLFPGNPKTVMSESSFALDKNAIQEINARHRLVYIFGEIGYTDAFSASHLTTFCVLYDPPNNDFDPCDTYNSAN